MGGSHQRCAEPVELRSTIVDVELARHARTTRLEHPGDGVAHRAQRVCPRCNGPVGLAEMNSTLMGSPARIIRPAVRLIGSTICRASTPCAAGLEHDVQEAGAGNVDTGDAGQVGEPLGYQLGDLARRNTSRLGQTHRHICGVVAVLLALGSLDRDIRRHRHTEIAGLDGGADRLHDGIGKFCGGHLVKGIGAGQHLRGSSSRRAR